MKPPDYRLGSICLRCGCTVSEDACPKCKSIISALPSTIPTTKDISTSQTDSHEKTVTAVQDSDLFIIVALLYGAACITFLLGIVLPLITIKKEVVIFGIKWVDEMNTVSLLSGTWALLTNRQLFLFLIIFFFSMVFPALKLFFLYKIGFDSKTDLKKKKHLGWLSAVGKWSMLDIFVVGLLVVTLKLGDLVEVKVHAGLYAFAASVLLTMILTLLAKTDRFPSGPPVNR